MIDALEGAGRALYGHDWRETLCADAGCSRRFLDRLMSGKNVVPPGFVDTVLDLLEERAGPISAAAAHEATSEVRRGKLLARVAELDEAFNALMVHAPPAEEAISA